MRVSRIIPVLQRRHDYLAGLPEDSLNSWDRAEISALQSAVEELGLRQRCSCSNEDDDIFTAPSRLVGR